MPHSAVFTNSTDRLLADMSGKSQVTQHMKE